MLCNDSGFFLCERNIIDYIFGAEKTSLVYFKNEFKSLFRMQDAQNFL